MQPEAAKVLGNQQPASTTEAVGAGWVGGDNDPGVFRTGVPRRELPRGSEESQRHRCHLLRVEDR